MKFTFAPESKPLDGYTIKRAIQRGGFGEVYYALSDAGKEVALKLVQQNMEIELRGVTQCLNLKHPNLVTIFDIRTDTDGDHWIVMEYVAGKSLDRVLADHPNGMPLEEVRRWLADIVSGINYLHDKGLVHRDLKPANIYSEGDQIKIGDVGLSKFISPSRRSAHSQSVGTVYYMAPEVAHGRYGQEVDVYSLAVILYEMLTGRVPFDGETTAEILMKHLSERPDLSAIPERLRPVLANALEKDPQRRTSSAVELEREFNNAVLGIEIPREISGEAFVDDRSHASTAQRNEKRHTPYRDEPTEQSVSGHREQYQNHQNQNNHGHHDGHSAHGHPVPSSHEWQRGNFNHRKIAWIVIAMCVFFAIASRTSLAPLAAPGMKMFFIVGVLGVLGYGGLRLFQLAATSISGIFRWNRSAKPHPRNPVVEPQQHGQKPKSSDAGVRRTYGYQILTPNSLRRIPMRHRMTELTGAMLFAVLCTAILTTGLYFLTSFLPDPGAVGLFAMTTLVGSWAILIPAKLWEGTRIDSGLRRMVLLTIGCLVGVLAYAINHELMVDLPSNHFNQPLGLFVSVGNRALLNEVFQPTLAGYIVFFGALFSLRRWWRQVDVFRSKRFRVLSLLMTLLVAYLVTLVWAFPQGWALTWAAAISSVVQLSAIWVSEEYRQLWMEGHSHE